MKTKIKLPKPRDEVMKYHLENKFNCGCHKSKKSYNRKDKSWKKALSDFPFLLARQNLTFAPSPLRPFAQKNIFHQCCDMAHHPTTFAENF